MGNQSYNIGVIKNVLAQVMITRVGYSDLKYLKIEEELPHYR